jgi:hypothetical protein
MFPARVILAGVIALSQTVLLDACDSTGRGVLGIAAEESHCHPWPACTRWTPADTIRLRQPFPITASQADDSVDIMVDRFDLAPLEIISVDLEAERIYRVEFTAENADLEVRPGKPDLPLPTRISRVTSLRASGVRVLEIVPKRSGEYRFRMSGPERRTISLTIILERRARTPW